MSRIARVLSVVSLLVLVSACSDDESTSESSGGSTDTTPYGALAGNWGVAVTAKSTNCQAEVFFAKEMWMVSTLLASVSARPIPDTSSDPLLVTPDSDPVSYPLPEDATATQSIPPEYSGLITETLGWSASLEQTDVTDAGCLERKTTVLAVQFTAEGQLQGTRSVFHEYSGGTDCTASCRSVFELAGAILPEE
jgi:hypothetical protein